MSTTQKTLINVREYYGNVLKSQQDLKTSACCSAEAFPAHIKDILSKIHPEVLSKFYGCGSPLPPLLEGKTVLDLGCGTGRDCFLLSKLVGSEGQVIGVDMTDAQLEVANRHLDYHMKEFGYSKSNVQFLKGYIEDLESLDIKNDSIDIVVSNCVVNLSPNKDRVFSEIFRVLKPEGELYFSDVFANRRIPKNLAEDPILLGECLGGALYNEDFRRILSDIGCSDYRTISQTPLTLRNAEIKNKIGMIDFTSMTVRAFKLKLEDRCEDYGQVATYLGTISEHPYFFILDNHHKFEKGRPLRVCGNTAAMLQETRYAPYFKIDGNLETHYGLFPCVSNEDFEVDALGGPCC